MSLLSPRPKKHRACLPTRPGKWTQSKCGNLVCGFRVRQRRAARQRVELKSSPAPSGFKRPESVLVVVYTDSGETLLLQRTGGGFWQSVTGSLQSLAETPEAAARRELYEETGIEADGGWRNHQLAERFYILPEYRYRYGPGVTENLEHVFSLRLPERCEVLSLIHI